MGRTIPAHLRRRARLQPSCRLQPSYRLKPWMPALRLLSKTRKYKKWAYERRIREVEHASFTPLVFSASGGMAREATSFYKRLAPLLAAKRDQTYSCTITWLRCLLSFSLLRSAIQCIRGARSSKGQPIRNPILDIVASGLWGGRFQHTFVDVRVFNPHAASNPHTASNRGCQLSACYRKHENTKKWAYERRIREVEHASFTPLVFSASGGMAREATSFYKRLASLLAAKRDQTYSCTITWLRCLLSFSLLRSAIQCIRGARSSKGQPIRNPIPCDVIMREALVSESR